jgi:hypothetical protein
MGSFDDLLERTETVTPGGAAVLELPPILSHPPPSVNWQTDDGAQLYDRKYASSPNNQLIILSASETDQKAYRYCIKTYKNA